MGGFATLHFGLHYPTRAHAIVVAGCGYGAEPGKRQQFQQEAEKTAANLQAKGMAEVAPSYAQGPTRVQFQNKDPRGFAECVRAARGAFDHGLGDDAAGRAALAAVALRSRRRDSRKMTVPTLIMTGDEDWPCLEPDLFLKRTIPSAALVVLPNSGHVINLEEPARFNRAVADFFHQVENGRWPQRDARAMAGSILGLR